MDPLEDNIEEQFDRELQLALLLNSLLKTEGRFSHFSDLAAFINELIDKDFNRLVSLLYRIDVDEAKLRRALSSADGSATSGQIIARLIVKREMEKMKTRRENS